MGAAPIIEGWPGVQKPAYGQPCNGCGLCCIAQQCPLSLAIFGKRGVCPALERGEGKTLTCGLVRSTGDYVADLPAWGGAALSEAFGLLLGAGVGCDGTMGGEEPEAAARAGMTAKAIANLAHASPEAAALVAYFRSAA